MPAKKSAHVPSEPDVRREKIAKITQHGIQPYPQVFAPPTPIAEVLTQEAGARVRVAGRVMRIRHMGKLVFADVVDGTQRLGGHSSSKVQIQISGDKPASVGGAAGKNQPTYNAFTTFHEFVDPGDFVLVEGMFGASKTKEKTVFVEKLQLLAKALQPLPEKFHGLQDQELRYRKRYLDLLTNPETRRLFEQRSLFIRNFRKFLDGEGFLEVETPVLELVPGGADAEPFKTHHHTLDLDLYLRISLELHLKRLLVGGMDRVYEIGKVFRNEGMSTEHLQEFTELEFYQAYADYEQLIGLVERCYRWVFQHTFQKLTFAHKNQVINFEKKWQVVDYVEALRDEIGFSVIEADDKKLRSALQGLAVPFEPAIGRGRMIDLLYKKTLRPKLFQPTILKNHPVAVSPLAKRHRDNPELTERISVVVAGSEVGNGFSELNDPIDQRQRFEQQAKLRAAGDREAQMTDEDFLAALEHGMPPAAGFGVGIDRLFMLLIDQPSIRDVVLFPTMRPER